MPPGAAYYNPGPGGVIGGQGFYDPPGIVGGVGPDGVAGAPGIMGGPGGPAQK